MKLKVILVMAGVVALSAVSFGQRFGGMMGGNGGGNPAMLLRRDDVKEDLKLTDDQKSKLQEIQDGMRQKFMDAFQSAGDDQAARTKAMTTLMKGVTDEVNKVLTADQQKRLKEISVQIGGNAVVMQADIQKDLAITADQKAKLDDLSKRQQAAMREVFQKMQAGEIQREDMPDIMKKNTKVMNDEIDKILTKDQKDKLKGMGGKKFVQAEQAPGGGGR